MNKDYRTPKPKEIIKIKRYLDDMTVCSMFIKNTFIGKCVFFCTDTNKVSMTFIASNYMHLCGFLYDKGANSFFTDCCNKTLDISKLKIKKDGTTFLKLGTLNSLPLLIKENCSLTGQGQYLYIKFDYAIRTRKNIISLALGNKGETTYPKSLLALFSMKNFPRGERIIFTYSQDLKTKVIKELYKEDNN